MKNFGRRVKRNDDWNMVNLESGVTVYVRLLDLFRYPEEEGKETIV